MSLDTSLLASTVVSSFLLPYAKLSVQKIAEKATDSVSEQAAQEVVALTKAVWEKVKTVFTGDDAKRLEQFKETARSNPKGKNSK